MSKNGSWCTEEQGESKMMLVDTEKNNGSISGSVFVSFANQLPSTFGTRYVEFWFEAAFITFYRLFSFNSQMHSMHMFHAEKIH